jgi:MoxR-like ATPase
VLLEDVPGVGKTSLAVALGSAMSLDYKRIQFTPEVMPADVVGYSLFDKKTGTRIYQPGVALCNLLLVDEINRASSKTQSALLEAMEEQAVTVDGITYQIESPFTVIATQNPVGSAGTQLLPESQLDRFMLRLSIGYPAVNDEADILKRHHNNAAPLKSVQHVTDANNLREMQSQVEAAHIDDDLCHYIAQLVNATREDPSLRLGASPRASLALLRMSKAVAWLSGRDYVLPSDIHAIFYEVLEHRVSSHSQTRADASSIRDVLANILSSTPQPNLRNLRS